MTQSINFENGDETFNIDLDADGNLNFNANDVDGGGDRRLVINDDSGEITIGENIFLRGADGSVNALAGRFDGKVEINGGTQVSPVEDALVVSVPGTETRVSIGSDGIRIDGGDINGNCTVTGNMRIEGAGLDVPGGTVTVGTTLEVRKNAVVRGSLLVFGAKNFVQDHPIDRTKEIVYTSLEGGEAGTYTRGMARLLDGQAEIQLPEHFGLVTTTEGLTIHLTSHGKYLQLYVSELSTTRCVVREAQGRSGNFYYLIQGVRKGQENYSVIRTKEVSTLARQQAAYPNPNSH
jgi:hypothetical protein